jgi:leucyl/phenylalanyl-tRNA--protein transferase
MPIYRLTDALRFPPVDRADPDGLLAVGGDLSIERLLLAYRSGIFPWYSEDDPILWWSPDPRFVLFPSRLKVSSSMQRVLKGGVFRVTLDQGFRAVMVRCGTVPRRGQSGTWITNEMLEAYTRLHEAGYAHSVEVWKGSVLAGGLYGVSLGRAFFGESMFTEVSNASKVGLITLVRRLEAAGFTLIDSQVYTRHLESLGAEEIPRSEYLGRLRECLSAPTWRGKWVLSAPQSFLHRH